MFTERFTPGAGAPLRLPKTVMSSYLKRHRVYRPSPAEEWQPVLDMLGVGSGEALAIEARATLSGLTFQAELLSSGRVCEMDFFRALARWLGLGFETTIRPHNLIMQEDGCLEALQQSCGVRAAAAYDARGNTVLLIAPHGLDISGMLDFLKRYDRLRLTLRIIAPTALREAIKARAAKATARMAVSALFEHMPSFSARTVVNAWQGALFGALAFAFPASLLLWPVQTLLVTHIVLSVFFFSCILLRFFAGLEARKTKREPELCSHRPADMPVYTVLVALYREADVVPQLLMSLNRLVWPRGKLEIKLVCEADDHETLNAIRAHQLRPYVEVIEVPDIGPRTKPKALSYALPLCRGDFVVLYDAEDRPHPFQLMEAWQSFEKSTDDLACLQAPLAITNGGESWISSMFAFEYSALFSGLLPWLARRHYVMPLGGTSNHFRREALEAVGGWDPYNVTEDADLGMRLRRFGYRSGVLTYPTLEDAPSDFKTWLPQRTRWFKGWAQTWLVHMRNPSKLLHELGWGSFIMMQIMVSGMLVSALAYAVFTLTALFLAGFHFSGGELTRHQYVLLCVDLANVILGHVAFIALGWWTLPRQKRLNLAQHALNTPRYWFIMSIAAWRAIWQLCRRPHLWEKTPHKPHRNDHFRKSSPLPTILPSSLPMASLSRPS
ncbi:glycosyltransferase family 2 protein [Nitratireductor basaltis]|uniref:Glycosyl transferase family protein n=1 Tax=Nitratireductor basaltis TaxID=472175 RepID=A0A084UE09_9HYPH|nr:glycosyltransferase [Nitratireductor basaltis]KFB11195.1 Glycosyl transferase family protein [Nitratireductor basaltis]